MSDGTNRQVTSSSVSLLAFINPKIFRKFVCGLFYASSSAIYSSQVCLRVILRKFVCDLFFASSSAIYSSQVRLRFFYASSSALVRTKSASLQVRLYVSRPGRNHQLSHGSGLLDRRQGIFTRRVGDEIRL